MQSMICMIIEWLKGTVNERTVGEWIMIWHYYAREAIYVFSNSASVIVIVIAIVIATDIGSLYNVNYNYAKVF